MIIIDQFCPNYFSIFSFRFLLHKAKESCYISSSGEDDDAGNAAGSLDWDLVSSACNGGDLRNGDPGPDSRSSNASNDVDLGDSEEQMRTLHTQILCYILLLHILQIKQV